MVQVPRDPGALVISIRLAPFRGWGLANPPRTVGQTPAGSPPG